MNVHSGHRQRRREQFLQHGLDSFADHEILELLLFYAIPRQDTNPIAHELIKRFGSLEQVLAAPVEELAKSPGMGKYAATLLKLVPQITRRARASSVARERALDTSERIGAFFVEQFVAESSEIMYQLCLDAKGRMLSCHRIGEGDVSSVSLNMRKIVEIALRSNAALVALAHNHPSGVALPSQEDRIATRMAAETLDTIGVRLVDHIIVADDDFISLRQAGMM